MREALVAALGHCDVHEAASGQAAMECLHRHGALAGASQPDLIYLDIKMPGTFGQEILKTIKSDPDLKNIAVVMMTGLTDREQQEEATRNGADDYVVKPSDPKELLPIVAASVKKWLKAPVKCEECAVPGDEEAGSNVNDVRHPIEHPSMLIVEDDADQRELICEVLGIHFNSPDGCDIVAVATAAEALRQDLALFDIVLLDYYLPDMPGLTLLEEILSHANLPVIFVTGQNDSTTAAEAIRKGAQDYIVKLGDYLFALPIVVEKNIRLHQIKIENEHLQQSLRLKNEQLEESLEKLRMMAETDHLTGLANRRSFSEFLERLYGEAVRYGHDLTCYMCDLDYYKRLNDTLGHQIGDKVLILTANIIRSSLRSSDMAARYGGDEFVILLPHTDVESGLAVGERIRQELVLRSQSDQAVGHAVTMSVGVASLTADGPSSGDALVSMADRALYLAKARGKNKIVAFNEIRSLIEETHTPA